MSTKAKVIGVVILVVASFAAGRWASPTKIITETKIVEVKNEKENKQTDTDKHKESKTIVVEKPDGSKETTTTTTEDTTKKVSDEKTTDTKTTVDKTKEIVYAKNRLSISALVGANSLPPAPVVYGGHVTYSILGPINVGVWGLSNLTFGVSLGLGL